MANDLTGDPIIVDTASGTTVILPALSRIRAIKWVGAVAPADVAIVSQKLPLRELWKHVAAVAGESNPLDVLDLFVKGEVIVPTLSSGKLYLYRGSERGA